MCEWVCCIWTIELYDDSIQMWQSEQIDVFRAHNYNWIRKLIRSSSIRYYIITSIRSIFPLKIFLQNKFTKYRENERMKMNRMWKKTNEKNIINKSTSLALDVIQMDLMINSLRKMKPCKSNEIYYTKR